MEFVDVIENILPSQLCKQIIDRFNPDTQKHQGKLGPGITNFDIKNSIDLHIANREDWSDITNVLAKHLAVGLQEYFKYIESRVLYDKNLNILGKIFGDNINCTGYQIQKYEKGCKFEWHTDDAHDSKRLLAFIMYLNTVPVENGGSTDFLNGKSIQPKEGSILFFPATWSYLHRGNVIKSGEKYIITGFIVQSNLKICDKSST